MSQLSFYKLIAHFIFNNVCLVLNVLNYAAFLIFLVTLATLSMGITATKLGPGNLTRVMRIGQTHRHMHREAGIWWAVPFDGDAPGTWKLSAFIIHHWVRRQLYCTELNQEEVC